MIDLRAATADDFDIIWPLLRAVFRAGDTYAVDRDISRDAAFDLWIKAPRRTYLATDGTKVLGTYYIKTNQAGGGAHICNCGYITHAAARGRGVGQAMCAHSLTEARNLGYRAMQFNFVLASNKGALRLWDRMGFETVGRIPNAFQHPERGFVDALVLYQTL